jgi:hypothetical protein
MIIISFAGYEAWNGPDDAPLARLDLSAAIFFLGVFACKAGPRRPLSSAGVFPRGRPFA